MRHRSLVVVCLFIFAASLSAATFDLPSDRDLLDRADLVVVATVMNAAGRAAEDGWILTDYQLRVEDVLKGEAAATIVVSESGGLFNGRGIEIAGSAVYEPGTRVLAFLRLREDGTYYTAYMGLGKYRFKKELLVRDADGIETLSGDAADVRNANAFLDAIRSGAPSRAPRVASLMASDIASDARPDPEPRTLAAASAYVLTSNGPKRWKNCDIDCTIGFTLNNGSQNVTSPTTGLEKAYNAWSNHTNSFVDMISTGIGSDTGRTNDDENDIVFNWDGSNPHATCEAAKGCGIVYFNGLESTDTHMFRGEEFSDVIAADVLIHASVTTQTAYESILTHELGHGLAFRHSDSGTPSSSAGVMRSSVPTSVGATLGPWEQEAMTVVYGPGLACVPPTITSTSGGGTVTSGQTKTLTVTATGDSPLSYQWYEGASGNTSTPVGTNSSTFVTPPITSTKQYWVKVSNACPPAAGSATITINVATCNAPNITTQTQSHQIAPNATTNLIVSATGTGPLTYRWYRANTVGDTSQQVATTASFTTPSLTETTSYWARVTNDCGQDDTTLVIVTVGTACVAPSITVQSPNLTIQQGEGVTISVSAVGTAPLAYQWYQGDAPNETLPIAGANSASYAAGPFPNPGANKFWAKVSNGCPPAANSATITITVGCPPIELPLVSTPASSHFSNGYNVFWTGSVTASTFEVQEATDAAFTQNVQTFPVTGALLKSISPHLEIAADTRFYYRVRAIPVCPPPTPGAWSNTASTVVTRPLPEDSEQFGFSVPEGATQSFTQNLLVPGFGETATNNDTFSIAIDVPWITVFPATGALSAGGTTVQLTINPTGLEVGSTTGTIQITRTQGAAANGIATHDGPVTSSVPLGLSLVTPVSPDPRDGNPPPGTLIVPAVAHAQGIGSPFRSDVRIVNVSFSDIDYEISYTPSQSDGLQTGKKTTVTIHSGDVLALDDLVASWFGAGMLGEGGIGTIEIRPLNAASPNDTFASSRTYALTAGGTLGQFIPALRTNQFIGNIVQDSLARISLQMIAANAEYRTNIGFVEGTGAPVNFVARLVDGNNNVLNQFNGSLPPFGHLQRSVPDLFGGVSLTDGRVEVEVNSAGGKVSAYASVLNNKTNDPLMVFPAQPARTTAERYVLAGIAEFVGGSNFHSDMRIYNAGASAVTATLNFYPFGSDTPQPGTGPVQLVLNPGQVRAIDDVLPSLWPGLTGGGSVIATTPGPSSLVLTAQTFSLQPDGGTKGQFIPGVTHREAVGLGDRPLEILQLEQSDQYRSNVGFVEVTGKPVVIEVTAFEPDAKISVSTQIPLKANEYTQYARLLSSMGLGTVYNGRVSVKVVSGEGRVYAYGSAVDNRTEDPTYVPAQ